MIGSELMYLRVKQHRMIQAGVGLMREAGIKARDNQHISWWLWDNGLIDNMEADLINLDLHS